MKGKLPGLSDAPWLQDVGPEFEGEHLVDVLARGRQKIDQQLKHEMPRPGAFMPSRTTLAHSRAGIFELWRAGNKRQERESEPEFLARCARFCEVATTSLQRARERGKRIQKICDAVRAELRQLRQEMEDREANKVDPLEASFYALMSASDLVDVAREQAELADSWVFPHHEEQTHDHDHILNFLVLEFQQRQKAVLRLCEFVQVNLREWWTSHVSRTRRRIHPRVWSDAEVHREAVARFRKLVTERRKSLRKQIAKVKAYAAAFEAAAESKPDLTAPRSGTRSSRSKDKPRLALVPLSDANQGTTKSRSRSPHHKRSE